MAPSSFKKIGAAVACATAVRAATESYQLSEEYTADNFFDKFDFFTSTYTSGDSWDDTHGYVQYRGKADAESLGLISTSSGQVFIGPDANSTYDAAGTGRDSVRMTSKASYNEGLMIAKFSHMPKQACGAWPAFWSFGAPWLTLGEIDYFEGWNEMDYNRMAMHTNESLGGECSLTTTGIEGSVMTEDCNNGEDMTGCGVKDTSGVWGSTTGATFAMEWTTSAIKIWSWVPSAVPADITAGAPDPSSGAWGNPTLLVEQTNCDLSKSFGNQQLVFNIDFCGDTAGSPTFWNQTCSAWAGDSCANYVANNPAAFAETYFMVEGIQYYEMDVTPVSASVTASASIVLPTSTSVVDGLLAGTGSVLESTLGATATSTLAAAVTEAAQPSSSHFTTGYIYGTSVSTDEVGSETTLVVIVDTTTFCPFTAAEASASSLASQNSIVEAAHTTSASQSAAATSSSASAAVSSTRRSTLTSYLTSTSTATSVQLTTSTIFSTSASTITSCAPAATSCSVGDVTTVVIAVSTTICPVTAAEPVTSRKTHTLTASASSVVAPSSSGDQTSENSPVEATGTSSLAPSPVATGKSTLAPVVSASASSSSGKSASDNSPVHATESSSLQSSSSASRKTTLTPAAAASHTPVTSQSSETSEPASPTTEVMTATETGGSLELATDTPSSVSLEWLTAGIAAASSAAASGENATATSSSSAAGQTSCSGLDCVVVTAGGTKTDGVGASGFALVVLAGAMFLF